jgi:hypothetical protein
VFLPGIIYSSIKKLRNYSFRLSDSEIVIPYRVRKLVLNIYSSLSIANYYSFKIYSLLSSLSRSSKEVVKKYFVEGNSDVWTCTCYYVEKEMYADTSRILNTHYIFVNQKFLNSKKIFFLDRMPRLIRVAASRF